MTARFLENRMSRAFAKACTATLIISALGACSTLRAPSELTREPLADIAPDAAYVAPYCAMEQGANPPKLANVPIDYASLDGQRCNAALLRSAYSNVAAKLTWQKPAADVITLGSAFAAALSVALEWHTDILKVAGVTAAGAQASSLYINTGEKLKILGQGQERLGCVLDLTTNLRKYQNADDIEKAVDLISSTVGSIRSDIDNRYVGTSKAPSFETFFNMANANIGYGSTDKSLMEAIFEEERIDFEELSIKLAKCATTV